MTRTSIDSESFGISFDCGWAGGVFGCCAGTAVAAKRAAARMSRFNGSSSGTVTIALRAGFARDCACRLRATIQDRPVETGRKGETISNERVRRSADDEKRASRLL